MTVAPVLAAAVFEAQNKSRLHRCLSKCYIGGEKLVSKVISARGGLIFEVHCTYLKISSLPCLIMILCALTCNTHNVMHMYIHNVIYILTLSHTYRYLAYLHHLYSPTVNVSFTISNSLPQRGR